MNPKVDWYFSKNERWEKEIKKLRTIILDCELNEELKWGCPCYTYGKSNIVLIHVFKEYCALLFFKGALLKDTDGLLIQQTENVQAARQVRFTNLKEIVKLEKTLKAYIYQAIEVDRAGLKVTLKKPSEFKVAEEFQKQLDKSKSLKTAFEKLTPGRQRGYLLYFSSAKQAKTREDRVKKSIPQILKGKGLED
jgi:uncharacterized protein YdeI (YjbR/CyaY-like superfamily)